MRFSPALAVAALALVASRPLAADTLPDLTAGLETGSCENGPGAEGADSHFHGVFTVGEQGVVGTETWLLHANSKWIAKGGKTCKVVWNMTGTKTTDTGSCGACTYGLQLHAEPDLSVSDCPEELLLGRRLPDGRRVGGEAVAFDVAYAVKPGTDKDVTIHFAKTGKRLGEGYAVGDALGYVTDHSCRWF